MKAEKVTEKLSFVHFICIENLIIVHTTRLSAQNLILNSLELNACVYSKKLCVIEGYRKLRLFHVT